MLLRDHYGVYEWRRTTRISRRRYDLQGQKSKVKVARSCDQSQPSRPNAVPMSLVAGGGILCWPNPAVTLCIKFCDFFLIHARRPCPPPPPRLKIWQRHRIITNCSLKFFKALNAIVSIKSWAVRIRSVCSEFDTY